MKKKLVLNTLGYTSEEKTLLEDISVEFESGILHGIIGPNGSGKSTLLKTLAGIWKPTQGAVYWEGEHLLNRDRKEVSRILSLVPQNPVSPFDFLVEDIVAMGRYPYNSRYWVESNESFIDQALHNADVSHLRLRKINQLSHGERQRVYIARALVTESPILLLDEPTASLDIRHRFEIWSLLQRLVDKGKIVIVTTHDLSIAERYCGQIVVISNGRCVGSGSYDSVMTSRLLQEVFGITNEMM